MKNKILLFVVLFSFFSFGFQKSHAQSANQSCIAAVKQYGNYLADCNAAGLRQICTNYFIDTYFEGMTDTEIRNELLSYPVNKRTRLKNDISNATFSAELKADGSFCVKLVNNRTAKIMYFYCERENGRWKIDSYSN